MSLPRITALVRGMRDNPRAIGPVAVAMIIGLCVFSFFSIADEVAEGEIAAVDEWLFYLFRSAADPSDPLGPPWLEEAAAEITALGGYPVIVLAVLIVVGLLLVTRRYGPALYTVVSVGIGSLLSHVLKILYERPRPDLVEHLDIVHTASFPSGHAMVGTVAYLTLAALVTRFFDDLAVRVYVVSVALAMALLIGLTRIYLGVHWPSDVAAGWALGIAWAGFAWLVPSALMAVRRSRNAELLAAGRDA
jgi:undecaprenyl-diphosphatase